MKEVQQRGGGIFSRSDNQLDIWKRARMAQGQMSD